MCKFKLDDKDHEAESIAEKNFFKPRKNSKVHGDNFMLDADRDLFIFNSGFEEGCGWMVKRILEKLLNNPLGDITANKYGGILEFQNDIVKFKKENKK